MHLPQSSAAKPGQPIEPSRRPGSRSSQRWSLTMVKSELLSCIYATLAQPFAMLSKVCSAAVNGIDAYPVEVEVNSGHGDTLIVMVGNN